MRRTVGQHLARLTLIGMAGAGLSGCYGLRGNGLTTGSITQGTPKVVKAPTKADRECLARAMYFESNRTSEDGMRAVGTVVMNRLDSPKYPGSVCEVVGQPRQFAPGVLTRSVRDQDRPLIEKVADAVLSGDRHPEVGAAMHFHTTGYTFKYTNMHYVADAGGNSFYEKTDREGMLPARNPLAMVEAAGGQLVTVGQAVLADASSIISLPSLPAITATDVAYQPTLPAGVPLAYTSGSVK